VPPLFRGREGRRQLYFLLATSAAVVVAVVLIVGVSGPPRPTGDVRSVEIRIVGQGMTSHGIGWFGTPDVNYSSVPDGYPFTFAVGSSFNYSLEVVNGDRYAHNLSAVSINAPFHILAMTPTLPYQIDGAEDFLLTLTLGSPTSSGAYSVVITLDTYG
jgi:hypothetical protein